MNINEQYIKLIETTEKKILEIISNEKNLIARNSLECLYKDLVLCENALKKVLNKNIIENLVEEFENIRNKLHTDSDLYKVENLVSDITNSIKEIKKIIEVKPIQEIRANKIRIRVVDSFNSS